MTAHAVNVHYALCSRKCLLHSAARYDSDMPDPATRLKKARISAGYETALDAAKALGVNPFTYAQHENGTRGIPKNKAPIYARRFRVDVQWLLYGGKPDLASLNIPSEAEVERMVEVALLEVQPGMKLAEIAPIVASALHAQLVRYRPADEDRDSRAASPSRGAGAQSGAPTTRSGPAE